MEQDKATQRSRRWKFGGLVAIPAAAALAAGVALLPGTDVQAQDEEETAAAAGEPGTYAVDPVHTSVVFRIMHLGVAPVYGRFNEISGTIHWDPDNPENSSFEFEVPAASVDTNNEQRDAHLRSADFFTVQEFPTIAFESTEVRHLSGNDYELEGELTLMGITETITVPFEKTGEGENQRGQHLIGGESIFTIDRMDYGIDFMPDGLGHEVRMIIAIEAIRQ